jgi:DNA/RNA endonuclease G (NUC1)
LKSQTKQFVLQQRNSQYKMIAFLIPNKSSELFNYVVSVDLIEQKTELTFPALEDSIEDELERSTERSPFI